EFVEVTRLDEGQPCRVDMAWNFNLSASSYITAHANLRVPGIQKLPAVFEGGQGVSWRSARSRFMVSLYNKSKEMHRPGEVLRAEVSLRGRQLAQRLHRDWRDFKALYQCFRSIMASIPPVQRPTKASGWPEAIGPESLE